jgi:hypothetical protein
MNCSLPIVLTSPEHFFAAIGSGVNRIMRHELADFTLAGLPDGQISEFGYPGELAVQPFREKYSAFAVGQIISTSSPVSSHRGAARDRHGRGAGCGGRRRRAKTKRA